MFLSDEADDKHSAREGWSKARTSLAHLATYGQTQAMAMGYQGPVDTKRIERKQLIKVGSKKTTQQPTEDPVYVKGVPLFADDFAGLASEESGRRAWVSSAIIEAYVLRLAPERTYIINCASLQAIMGPDANAKAVSSVKKKLKSVDFSQVDCVAGPLLVNNNHWTMLYANLQTKEVIIIDPYGPSSQDALHFRRWCSFAATTALGPRWTHETTQYSIQEKDDISNCGIYVIIFLTRLVNMNLSLIFDNTLAGLQLIRNKITLELKSAIC